MKLSTPVALLALVVPAAIVEFKRSCGACHGVGAEMLFHRQAFR